MWDIDSCIALSADVEVVLFQVWKLSEEGSQRSVVILGNCGVVVSVIAITSTKSNLNFIELTPPGLYK